jgi:hypothetical protein
MRDSVIRFLSNVRPAELYNESTLQMELGMFLRQQHPELKIHLERPITHFGKQPQDTKKEIDVSILDADGRPLAAIELKMPQNGKVPETMFEYCEDIRFCEALVQVGFQTAFAVILTDDHLFWEGHKQDGIYSHFRATTLITKTIFKPTGEGKNVTSTDINGSYLVNWHKGHGASRFAIIEIFA